MKRVLLSVLVVLGMMACTTDTTVDATIALGMPKEITVSFDEEDSRIELDDKLNTVWTKGDQVSVFYKSNSNDCWQFTGETGDRSGTLTCVSTGTGTTNGEKVVVVYPYNSDYLFTASNGYVEAMLPAVQTFKPNSFGVGSSIMIAESDYKQFALKNVCGWLKLQFTGSGVVRRITLEGNCGEQVAGGMIINPSNASCVLAEKSAEADDGEVGGTLVFEDSILKLVTLDCGNGAELNSTATTAFYIALPPQTFEKGVTVKINDSFEISTENKIEITRNYISPMSNVDVGTLKDAATLVVGEPVVNSAVSVDIPLQASGLTSVGYKVVEVVDGKEPTAPSSATLLYRTGKKIDGCPEMINLTGNDGLDRGKSFVVYIAATISSSEYYNNGEILSVKFTTPDNYADEDVVVIRTSAEGADILVQVPERIKQENRRIKWGVGNIAMLNYYGKAPIPEMLSSNDVFYPATLIKNDTTLNINHYNAYRRNENGEIGYYYFAGYNPDGTLSIGECPPSDPRVETGEAEPIQYYQHFQPGAPLVIMMSEVDYADCDQVNRLEGQEYIDHITSGDCDKKHPMIDFSWGPGWYWYPYDYQAYVEATQTDRDPGELPMPGVGGGSNQPTIDFDKFWYEGAWWRRLEITLPGPEEFLTGDVIINTSALTPDGGRITFTPTGDTFAYFMGIYPEQSSIGGGYQDLLAKLDGKAHFLQWLTTSEIAPYLSIFPYYADEGTYVFNLEGMYDLQAGMKYHVIVNAVPGKMIDGDLGIDVSKQKFQHFTFTLPNYSLAEPELVVTPSEAYSPYKVKFNVKNPNYATLPVKKVAYASNYTREFTSYMSAYGYTYADIVMANDGYANLTEAEIAQVNSDFGFDMEFDVRENSDFTLAVMGWNMEGRPSNPDKEGSKAVAEAHSASITDADPLDISKIEALKGDWTATATIKTIDYNTGKATASQKSWKVTIGDLKTNNTLSAEDYAIFEANGVNKETADAYLAEFNQMSEDYNKSVFGQNRVLCQGWDLSGKRETSTASPWDLFTMSDYNASKVDYLFYDFGPKWFLQVDAEGNVFIPVNYNVVAPVMCWYNGLDHYLCSGNYEKGIANYFNPSDPFDVQTVGIPVEISEDNNTITLKSVVVNTTVEDVKQDVTLYPTMIFNNRESLAFYAPYVVSEVVLTKGWTEQPAAPAHTKLSSHTSGFSKRVANGEHFKAPVKPQSRTVFVPKQQTKTKVVDYKFITKEEMDKGMDEYMSRFNRKVRK